MAKKIKAEYSSQWDSDAQLSKDDCGPTCIKTCLNAYGESKSVDEIFKLTGASASTLINFTQLITALNKLGYSTTRLKNSNMNKIKEYIDLGIISLTLIHYGDLFSRQDTYKGPHFVVVVGYDDNGYYVHDPDFWGNRRLEGSYHYYPKNEFESAFQNSSLDGNISGSALIINPKNKPASFISDIIDNMEQLPKDVILRDILNGMCGNTSDNEVKAYLDSNKNIYEVVIDILKGNDRYFKLWVQPQIDKAISELNPKEEMNNLPSSEETPVSVDPSKPEDTIETETTENTQTKDISFIKTIISKLLSLFK